MPGTRVTHHSGPAHPRVRARARGARAWGGVAVVGGNPGDGRKGAVGPLLGDGRRSGDGPRAWAAGARALGLWRPWNLGAEDWSAVQMVAELEAHQQIMSSRAHSFLQSLR